MYKGVSNRTCHAHISPGHFFEVKSEKVRLRAATPVLPSKDVQGTAHKRGLNMQSGSIQWVRPFYMSVACSSC